nr:MAG TPA: hypothetical protein [Bacteriophage sp.]
MSTTFLKFFEIDFIYCFMGSIILNYDNILYYFK